MIRRLTATNEWTFFSVLPKADRLLTIGWWTALLLRGVLPALFAIATGALIAAVQSGGGVARPPIVTRGLFVVVPILPPGPQAVSAEPRDRHPAGVYHPPTPA